MPHVSALRLQCRAESSLRVRDEESRIKRGAARSRGTAHRRSIPSLSRGHGTPSALASPWSAIFAHATHGTASHRPRRRRKQWASFEGRLPSHRAQGGRKATPAAAALYMSPRGPCILQPPRGADETDGLAFSNRRGSPWRIAHPD